MQHQNLMQSSNSSRGSLVGALSRARASTHIIETSCRSESAALEMDLGVGKRHADLWFSDGSVILQAEDTLFCVHISQLSRHSVFFRDMFSLPQSKGDGARPIITSDSFGSCPVVVLHDTAEDVGNLLTALYDGPWVCSITPRVSLRLIFLDRNFGNNDPADFRVVSGILRLSTKYLCDSLRAKALVHLSRAWPSDLKGWDMREDAARYEMDLERVTGCGHLYPSPIVSLLDSI